MDDPAPSAKQRAAQARCDAILHHARTQIRTLGVDRFNVNEVLRLSGGSKATLAKYFGGRTGLIAAAIGAEARERMAQLSQGVIGDLPLDQALEAALTAILRFYLSPGAISLYRAVVGSADPKAAAAFYEEGHAVIVDGLAALLSRHDMQGTRDPQNSRDVADQLVHAIRAGIYERTLIGLEDGMPAETEIAARVKRTIALALPGLETGDAR